MLFFPIVGGVSVSLQSALTSLQVNFTVDEGDSGWEGSHGQGAPPCPAREGVPILLEDQGESKAWGLGQGSPHHQKHTWILGQVVLVSMAGQWEVGV